MHYITRLLGGSKKEEPKKKDQEVESILDKLMPEEMQEEMYCFTLGDSELH